VLEHTTTDGLVLVSLLAGGGLAILVAGTGCRVGGGGGLEHRAGGLEGRSGGKGLHRSGCGCWGRETLHRGGGGSMVMHLRSRSMVNLGSWSMVNLGSRWHIGPHWSGGRLSGVEDWSGSWSRCRGKGLNGSWSRGGGMVLDGSRRHIGAHGGRSRGGLLENRSRCWGSNWSGGEALHRGGGSGCRGHIGPNWSWSRCSLLENRSWGRGGELTGGRVRSHGCGGGSWSIIVIARIGDGTSNHSQSQDEEFLPDKIGKYINIPSNTILSWHILTIFADLFALGATNRIMSSVSSSCTFIQSGESARPNGSAEYHKSTKHFSRRKICLIRQTDTSRPRHQMGLVFIS